MVTATSPPLARVRVGVGVLGLEKESELARETESARERESEQESERAREQESERARERERGGNERVRETFYEASR